MARSGDGGAVEFGKRGDGHVRARSSAGNRRPLGDDDDGDHGGRGGVNAGDGGRAVMMTATAAATMAAAVE